MTPCLPELGTVVVMQSGSPPLAHAGEAHGSFSFELLILGGALIFLGLSMRKGDNPNPVVAWLVMAAGVGVGAISFVTT